MLRTSWYLYWLLIAFMVSLGQAAPAQSETAVWRETTFDDFADGHFGDGGANTYISSHGRIQTVNRWDLNGDGHIDLVFNNSHAIREKMDLSLYYGNGGDFDVRGRELIPANGARWSTAADVDGDGYMDLVVANYSNGSWTNMDSYIYFGGPANSADSNGEKGWSFGPFVRRVSLPTSSAEQAAVADLDGDGRQDIVFAQSGGYWEYRHSKKEYDSPSRIYWGTEDGYSTASYTDLSARGACDVAISDLNGDGWHDLIFANRGLGEDQEAPAYIYWGSESGFANRLELPAKKASAVAVADLNHDGLPDLLLANEMGEASWAYLNEAGEFDPERKIEFGTYMAKDVVAADFNADGFVDVFFSNHQINGNRLTDSFLYWGAAEGFRSENRLALPTIGAWGVSAADLNGDSRPELVISNHREYYSYEVPSFIYWNTGTGFSASLRTPLYEHGPVGNTVADFDGDGELDIVMNSMIGGTRSDYDPNYIYWGNADGLYSVDARLELPGREVYESALADLDDDGAVDLVFANSGEIGRTLNEAWIYWNRDNQFTVDEITGLPGNLLVGVEVADLDRDGRLDVIVSGYPDTSQPTPAAAYIYWGDPEGYVLTRRTPLHAGAGAPSIADLNRDGRLDLVFGSANNLPDQPKTGSIFWGDGTRGYGDQRRTFVEGSESTDQSAVADFNRDGQLDIAFAGNGFGASSWVYFGRDGEFSAERRAELPSANLGVSIHAADVNGDGWLDIILPVYLDAGPPVSRTTHTPIWLGGPDSFSAERRIMLPTDSGTGALVSDFNRDGFGDVFIYCHRREGTDERTHAYGDHNTASFLYWGSAEGFSTDRRLEIPGAGPHYDYGVDLGRIDDRSTRFDYISSPWHAGGMQAARLSWLGSAPHGSKILFQLRTATTREELEQAAWSGPSGPESYYDGADTKLDLPPAEWLQYRAVLDTVNGANSPILETVELGFIAPAD